MQILCFPTRQIFSCVLTGKFKAPSPDWMHEHFFLAEYELIVMTEGTLYLHYDQENYTVQEGEYLILPPNNTYRQGFKPAYSAFYWLHFSTVPGNIPSTSDADNLPHNLATDSFFALPQMGTIPKLEKVVVLMKQLQDLIKNGYPSISVDTMATSILTELYGQLARRTLLFSPSSSQRQIDSDIIDYIRQNLSKNITIQEIADIFGYNAKYLSHKFAMSTGMPLKQYILNQKMDAANFLLSDTNKSVKDIARELGFVDSHNFSRTYKKLTGLSPSEYRNAFSKRLLFDH